ncbi:MAG TPA: hypothetical protein PLV32_14185 [Chitinophagaceae bacterium]|nr:hypothetical protein [Chitinophagaceae bacterium]
MKPFLPFYQFETENWCFLHRHSEEEVSRWFAENGFGNIRPLSAGNFSADMPMGFYKNIGVEGFKQNN